MPALPPAHGCGQRDGRYTGAERAARHQLPGPRFAHMKPRAISGSKPAGTASFAVAMKLAIVNASNAAIGDDLPSPRINTNGRYTAIFIHLSLHVPRLPASGLAKWQSAW
jgi:hypothetical protein